VRLGGVSGWPDGRRNVPWTVERKLKVGLTTTIVVFALIGGLATLTAQRLFSTWEDVEHTQSLLLALTTVLSDVQDIETGARGYAITGDEDFLTPYRGGAARLEQSLARLELLATGWPRPHAEAIGRLAHTRLAESTKLVEVRRRDGLEAASRRVREQRGKTVMDALRAQVTDLHQRERERLLEREAAARSLARATLGAMGGLLLVVLTLGGLLHRSITRELAQRRAAGEELQRASDAIHDLYNRAPCGYHSLDSEGRFLEVNDTELGWLGYRREDVISRLNFRNLLTPESLQSFLLHYPVFKQQGFIRDLEFDLIRKDGTTLPVLVSATAIYDEEGRFVRSRSSLFDNSESKRLQEERNRVFALVPDLLCVSGFDGIFRRVNLSWQRTLGYTLDDLTKRPFLDYVHPDDLDITQKEMGRLLLGQEVTDFENRYRHADGSYRWLSWKSSPDVARQLIYASARDVTEQKKTQSLVLSLNEDLSRNAARLEASNRELEAFSYSVSHDLRAPLRSIDGFSRVLLEDCAPHLGEEGRGHLDRIIRATGRMAELIDDLTKLARVSRSELNPQRVDLGELAHSIAASLTQRDPARRLYLTIAEGLRADADPALVRIVLENLLDNAWKFTARRAEARIEVGRQEGAEPDTFFVRDNGAGFDMTYASRLFGAFQRLHTEQEFPGTGIGLATVQRIIHRHGGRIWAESKVNEGATFYFTLT
jgi:PAS domain S-box-containing protein